MLMTTTETIPGYTIERILGLVEAGSYWGFRAVRGRVTKQAADLGANAIVSMHYTGGRPSGFKSPLHSRQPCPSSPPCLA
jgi:uncharacterized protein YbjQ (UPF0145 family)